MISMERLCSGVEGLDEKMEGGFFKGSINLVTGKTGTGKSAFCTSFLYSGIKKDEPGVYVTTEQKEEDIRADVEAMFNWNLKALEDKNLLKFLYLEPIIPIDFDITKDVGKILKIYIFDLYEKIEKIVKSINAKRLVIDSTTILEMFIEDDYMRRVGLMKLINNLKRLGVTAILTGSVPEGTDLLSLSGIIEFFVDSVIKLEFMPVAEEFKRTLTIRKMRRTDHSIYIHPFEITKSGLKIIEIK
jgi:KaiC/GvpD/RAD55 family RecA-like ATPase